MKSKLRTAKSQAGTTENYAFDAIDQVTGVNYGTSRAVSYNYDSVGNRTSVVDNGSTTSYTTNNLNQYTSAFGSGIGYDGNGNLTAQQSNGLSTLYFYDAQNRLVKATVGTNVTDFFYDAKNRVVKRVLNGTPTYLIYDGWSLVEERTSTGSVSARYVHGTNTDEILAKIDSTGAIYYSHDGLGSVTRLTNSTGAVVEKYSYDIFGKASIFGATGQQLLASSSYGNRFMFTGREYLKEVGLYDYRNRVYSQELGRFLQTDPIRFMAGDVNIYRYVGNRVNWYNDPSGLRGNPGVCTCEETAKGYKAKMYGECMYKSMWSCVKDMIGKDGFGDSLGGGLGGLGGGLAATGAGCGTAGTGAAGLAGTMAALIASAFLTSSKMVCCPS